jgi:hypothetical protein
MGDVEILTKQNYLHTRPFSIHKRQKPGRMSVKTGDLSVGIDYKDRE